MAAPAVVVGAGISGLAAARALRRAGREVVVLESRPRPGGVARTRSENGFIVELGPNTVRDRSELRELARDANVESKLSELGGETSRRFLVRRGRLVPLSPNPWGLLAGGVLGPLALLRAASEVWRRAGHDPDESVGAWARRRFGRRAAERLVDAAVLGIYAGDPEELSVRLAFPTLYGWERTPGSVLRGLAGSRRGRTAPRLLAYRGGWGEFAADLARDLDVRFGVEVQTIDPSPEGFEIRAAGLCLEASELVSALPAKATARLFPRLESLASVPHAPVAVIGLGYDRSAMAHPLDGFGALVPHSEGRKLLGVLFSSTLTPGRAPAGQVLVTCLLGGRRQADTVQRDDRDLADLAHRELVPLLGATARPTFATVERVQPGIPQPVARLEAIRSEAARLETETPGLHLLGAWRTGVAYPECAAAGWLTAQ